MLRTGITSLLQNEPCVFKSILSSSFNTSQIFNRKCKRERKKCERRSIPVAIVLCGCGVYDGTEISEAISSTIHICQKGMTPRFYAPDVEISEIVNHYTKEVDSDSRPRNGLIEAARLARSCIQPLCECEACMHKALVLPGGFGVTKTLSNFAEKGSECTVLPDLEKLIEDFYCAKKPIATMCIAGILVARVLKGCKITLGREKPASDWPYADAIKKARDMGAKVELKCVKGVTRCKTYNVLSTPAWMNHTASYADVHAGIGKLITMLKKGIQT
ncbi:glutamine amidotransferase-like class 1 domain-containing protein 3, mitochondrial [Osmia bicornis bicornis]|uniref:glutamine amidotransferase-like class 1 domain-containing protein 3, mitochondrial n=1 Tax=Osmia bicornis bicornis TaxID=1437191 RepID=UPI0010F5E8F3|nr:glutamine amidotransferase-like class 1 domain-containing protein 3, mitochondrial [Osmia bicornis bicornis]